MKSLYAPAFSAEWFHPLQAQGIGCGNCAHYTPTGEAGHGTCGFLSKDIEIEGALDHCEVAQHTEAVAAMVAQRLADNGYRIATPAHLDALRRLLTTTNAAMGVIVLRSTDDWVMRDDIDLLVELIGEAP